MVINERIFIILLLRLCFINTFKNRKKIKVSVKLTNPSITYFIITTILQKMLIIFRFVENCIKIDSIVTISEACDNIILTISL